MKVLQVTTHMNIGGIANYILSLAKGLKARGVDCIVASSGGDLEEELKRHGIEHKRLDIRTKFEFGPKAFRSIFALKRIMKEEGVDIIHAHSRVSQVASHFASRLIGVPYITTCHGYFKKRSRGLFDTWGTRVIAISDAVKVHLKEDLNIDDDRIALVYTGVDIDKFSLVHTKDELFSIKNMLGLKDEPIIGAIGRLSPVKGHRFLIEAIKDIKDRGQKVQGILIGDGPEEANLKGLVKQLGIDDSFYFFRSDLNTTEYLAIMDMFVFPSVKEGLGISLLEAMAAAKPCIASDIGGISDIIQDGENGILCPVGDVKFLTNSIIRFLNDEGLKRRLGQSAQNAVRANFSLDIMANKILDLYREAIGSYASK